MIGFWEYIDFYKGDLSYHELAEKSDVSDYGAIETARNNNEIPEDDIILNIASALKCDEQEIKFIAACSQDPDYEKSFDLPEPMYPYLRNEILKNCVESSYLFEIFSLYSFGDLEQAIFFVFFYYTVYIGERDFRADRAAKYVAMRHPKLNIEHEKESIAFFSSMPPDTSQFLWWIRCLDSYYCGNFAFPKFHEFPSPKTFTSEERFMKAIDNFNSGLKSKEVIHSIYLSLTIGIPSIKIWSYIPYLRSVKFINNNNTDFIYFLPDISLNNDGLEEEEADNNNQDALDMGKPPKIPITLEVNAYKDLSLCFCQASVKEALDLSRDTYALKVNCADFEPFAYDGQLIFYSLFQKISFGNTVLFMLKDKTVGIGRFECHNNNIIIENITSAGQTHIVTPPQIAKCYKVLGIWF